MREAPCKPPQRQHEDQHPQRLVIGEDGALLGARKMLGAFRNAPVHDHQNRNKPVKDHRADAVALLVADIHA